MSLIFFLYFHSTDLRAFQRINDTLEQKKAFDFIQNDSIKYSVVLMTCQKCVPVRSVGCRIVVDLSQTQIGIVKKIDYATWMMLLNDDKTDWAANLILYYLYDRDAILFSLGKKRDAWCVVQKHDDIQYWMRTIKK